MRFPIYQVDAFSERVFGGNPAAVVVLDAWLPDATLQAIAVENNLAETAFLVPGENAWSLRWFTPAVEVDLCGHATLASAFVVATALRPGTDRVEFETREAGRLIVTRDGDIFTLDFPARPSWPVAPEPGLLAALGGSRPREVRAARDFLVVFNEADEVRALAPDMPRLAGLDRMVIVTAPGEDVDFVSRFFAPGAGVPEDSVTGSAHCTLIPYWAERLGRDRLEARQLSSRGGELHCALAGDRVHIGGRAVLYLEGTISVEG